MDVDTQSKCQQNQASGPQWFLVASKGVASEVVSVVGVETLEAETLEVDFEATAEDLVEEVGLATRAVAAAASGAGEIVLSTELLRQMHLVDQVVAEVAALVVGMVVGMVVASPMAQRDMVRTVVAMALEDKQQVTEMTVAGRAPEAGMTVAGTGLV